LAQPPTLQALLKDPRTPGLRRHLRKIFVDPVGGSAEWGIVYLADRVGVLAVYSLSQRSPLKIGNFDAPFQGFENKQHIADWKVCAGTLAPVLPKPATAQPGLRDVVSPPPPAARRSGGGQRQHAGRHPSAQTCRAGRRTLRCAALLISARGA